MGKKKFYRELTVDGKVYQYNIGKDYIKIKDLGSQLFRKSEIGLVWDEDWNIICVTPGMITKMIKEVNKYPQKYPNLGKVWPEV
jgi:hypothetical protein